MEQISVARQIGLVVRNERTRQELTQQQLADAAGVSRGFVARLEKGAATAVYPQKLIDVLGALKLSLFLGEEDRVSQRGIRSEKPAIEDGMRGAFANIDFASSSLLFGRRNRSSVDGASREGGPE